MFPDLRGIEHAFFEAMASGYAQNVKKDTIDCLPHSKVIAFELGDYMVVDFYFTTPRSDKGVGQTVIWHQNVPVWTMHYGGWYAKIAIPFLRECLHRAYVQECRFSSMVAVDHTSSATIALCTSIKFGSVPSPTSKAKSGYST